MRSSPLKDQVDPEVQELFALCLRWRREAGFLRISRRTYSEGRTSGEGAWQSRAESPGSYRCRSLTPTSFGSVANGIRASVVRLPKQSIRLRRDPEDLFDVMYLTQDVTFCQPPNLSLANHIHGFVSRDGTQCSLDGSEPEAGGHALLHESMILLQNII